MNALELVLALLIAVLFVVELSGKFGIPYPILLVIGGLGLAVVPGLPEVRLEPDLVLLVFLPPLLFLAAYLTPLRDLRANLRPIALLSIGLVMFTIGVVGVVAHAAIPTLGWAGAFALGAIVAPTDAIAATSIFRRLKVPRRIITLLEGESLLNDAAALVAYRVAVAAALTGAFEPSAAVMDFGVAAVGGIAVGVIVGTAFAWLYARLSNPPVEVALSLVIPYAAYLPAEELHLSGVLAAVLAGLIMGRASARVLSPDTRILGLGTWQMLSFLLNGFAFILIGLQLPVILRGLGDRLPAGLGLGALVVGTVVLARIAWVYPATYLPRLIPSVRVADPPPPPKAVFVVAWAGLRGVVSLAAALALPIDFPERDLVLLLTFVVILGTLVGQGLTLPLLLRRLRLMDDGAEEREESIARSVASVAGLREVERLRPIWTDHLPLLDGLEAGFLDRDRHLPTEDEVETEERRRERVEHEQIRHDVIQAERAAVIELRDRGDINDEVLRRIERELDLEELRMEA